MELRFLEGNFEHGKFKLQWRRQDSFGVMTPWLDVPCVKEEKKPFWCEHIRLNGSHNQAVWVYFSKDSYEPIELLEEVPLGWNHCPSCGKERP